MSNSAYDLLSLISCLLLGPTESDVRRKLAEEEQAASAAPGYIAQHEVSVLGFITMGLDIEDQQYVYFSTTCTLL